MIRYLIARLDLTEHPDPKRVGVSHGHNVPERLRQWLETGFKQFTEDRYTFSIVDDPEDVRDIAEGLILAHQTTPDPETGQEPAEKSAMEKKNNGNKYVKSLK